MGKVMQFVAVILVGAGTVSSQSSGNSRYLEYPNVLPEKIFKAQKNLNPITGRVEIKLLQDGQAYGTR